MLPSYFNKSKKIRKKKLLEKLNKCKLYRNNIKRAMMEAVNNATLEKLTRRDLINGPAEDMRNAIKLAIKESLKKLRDDDSESTSRDSEASGSAEDGRATALLLLPLPAGVGGEQLLHQRRLQQWSSRSYGVSAIDGQLARRFVEPTQQPTMSGKINQWCNFQSKLEI